MGWPVREGWNSEFFINRKKEIKESKRGKNPTNSLNNALLIFVTDAGLAQKEQCLMLCSTGKWSLIVILQTTMNWSMQCPVSFSHSLTFPHAAKQTNTTSRQLSSERTVNGVFSSQSQNNLHLLWNTTMNHCNLSFLEIFFISFYKFHPSSAEQCLFHLHLKTPQMRALVIYFLVSNCTHFQPEDG